MEKPSSVRREDFVVAGVYSLETDSRNGPFSASCKALPDLRALSLKGVEISISWLCDGCGALGFSGVESSGTGVALLAMKAGGDEGMYERLTEASPSVD
ncbi:hypothetical protein KCU81_g72, partial [Aureobasidium melanogenum]